MLSTRPQQPRPSRSAASLLREYELEGPLVLAGRTFLRVSARCPSRSVCRIRTACVQSIVQVQMRPELLFRIPPAEMWVRWHRSRASDDTWQGGSKPTKKPNGQARSYAGFQMFKHMLRVDTRGDKLRAFLGHGSQKPQSTVVNEGDFTEVNRASSPVLCTVPFFPACPQFADPGLDQTTFEGPPLFCGRFGDGNSQHSRGSFSSPRGVRPWFTGRFGRPISSAILYQRGSGSRTPELRPKNLTGPFRFASRASQTTHAQAKCIAGAKA